MSAVVNSSGVGHGALVIDITGEAATHDVFNILNPEGVPIAILESTMYIVTPGLANCDLHIGVGAASTGVGQNTICDNFPVDGGAGTCYALTHPTAAATLIVPTIVTAAQYITGFTDTAFSTGFVGKLFLRYIRLTD
jgi:hypothetical protein